MLTSSFSAVVVHGHHSKQDRSAAQAYRYEPALDWDIICLPTTVRGSCLYQNLVIDVWSRNVEAWDVAE